MDADFSKDGMLNVETKATVPSWNFIRLSDVDSIERRKEYLKDRKTVLIVDAMYAKDVPQDMIDFINENISSWKATASVHKKHAVLKDVLFTSGSMTLVANVNWNLKTMTLAVGKEKEELLSVIKAKKEEPAVDVNFTNLEMVDRPKRKTVRKKAQPVSVKVNDISPVISTVVGSQKKPNYTKVDKLLEMANRSKRGFKKSVAIARAQADHLYDTKSESWREAGYSDEMLRLIEVYKESSLVTDRVSGRLLISSYASMARKDRIDVFIDEDGPVLSRRDSLRIITTSIYDKMKGVSGNFNRAVVSIMQELLIVKHVKVKNDNFTEYVDRIVPGITQERLLGLLLGARVLPLNLREDSAPDVNGASTISRPEEEGGSAF
jgi:hypothetical protein